MRWQPADDPECPAAPNSGELVLLPLAHDVGGFGVRRALPAKERQVVGPFIFFDQMGPGEFLVGCGLDVRPHPHIGLSTVTYLFVGEILHRDRLGPHQPIVPGDVNWMTAGRGIAHSERTDQPPRVHGSRLFGIQSWVALPETAGETAPAFVHHPGTSLPVIEDGGVRLRLIAGEAWGPASPVAVFSPLFHTDAVLAPGSVLPLPDQHEERAAYVLDGEAEVAGDRFVQGRMLVFRAGDRLALRAGTRGARLLLLGGAAMGGARYLFWNFVSSSRERIEQAKADWKTGRFAKVPGDETEFIPVPERVAVRAGSRPAELGQVSEGSPTS